MGANSAVRPEDRLFHLTLALMATSYGLTKDQILSTVRGYREDVEAGVAKPTIERRFERDKDLLRQLGIPLEAVIPPDEDGNNKATIYRIPKDRYDPPAGFELTAQDIRLLNVAAAVWREGSLSGEARVTHTKLAAVGAPVDETLIGFLPMITARDPALQRIREALSERWQVRFDYLTPGQTEAKTRTVSPLAVVLHEGRWHVLSVEEPTGQERTFLLRRIVSAVTILDQPARVAQSGQVELMTKELDVLYHSHTATVVADVHSAAYTVLSNRAGTTVEQGQLQVHFTDLGAFADELVEYADQIDVVSPGELREALAHRLRQVVRDHG